MQMVIRGLQSAVNEKAKLKSNHKLLWKHDEITCHKLITNRFHFWAIAPDEGKFAMSAKY